MLILHIDKGVAYEYHYLYTYLQPSQMLQFSLTKALFYEILGKICDIEHVSQQAQIWEKILQEK